ncbi:MAG: LysR family transcriptional regulator [Hyphomicrobiales bacterium]
MHKGTANWDDLKFVLAVAEAGSLSAAARKLGVNHATVLRRISAFEHSHKVNVFERSGQGYKIKPESFHILTRLQEIQKSVDGLERSISGLDTETGTVRITSTDSLCKYFLVRYVRGLNMEFPGVQVTLSVTNARLDLSQMDAEFSVRPAQALPHELEGVRVCPLRFRVYGASDYLAQNPSNQHRDHSWLGVSQMLIRAPVGAWQRSALNDNVVFRADSFLTLAAAAETGMGLTMLPAFIGDQSAMLQRAEQFTDSLENDIWVAAHPDVFRLERIQRLISFVTSSLRADADTLSGERTVQPVANWS